MFDRKNILVAFLTGAGASGVAGSLIYAALSDVGFTPKTTLLLMLVVPLVEFASFLFIKESNTVESSAFDSSSTISLIDDDPDSTSGAMSEATPMSLTEKRQYLPKLTKYFVPLLIACLCEYTISQMVGSI